MVKYALGNSSTMEPAELTAQRMTQALASSKTTKKENLPAWSALRTVPPAQVEALPALSAQMGNTCRTESVSMLVRLTT